MCRGLLRVHVRGSTISVFRVVQGSTIFGSTFVRESTIRGVYSCAGVYKLHLWWGLQMWNIAQKDWKIAHFVFRGGGALFRDLAGVHFWKGCTALLFGEGVTFWKGVTVHSALL